MCGGVVFSFVLTWKVISQKAIKLSAVFVMWISFVLRNTQHVAASTRYWSLCLKGFRSSDKTWTLLEKRTTHLLIKSHVHKLHNPLLYVRSAAIPDVPLGSSQFGQELQSLGRGDGYRGLWGSSTCSCHWMEAAEWEACSEHLSLELLFESAEENTVDLNVTFSFPQDPVQAAVTGHFCSGESRES